MDHRTVIIKRGGGFRAFLRGAVIGAVVALLFAPRSGRETRDILTEKSTEFRDKASDIARDTRIRAESVISDARNKLDETMRSAKEGIDEGSSEAKKDLKRELEITEDINNPYHPL
jgi:gas vesicle protein